MRWLSNLTIPLRLGLGFGLLLALLLAVVVMAASRMKLVDQRLNQIVDVDARKLALVTAMRDALRDQAVAIRDVVLQEDLSFVKTELARMKTVSEGYFRAKVGLEEGFSDAALRSKLAALKPLEDRFKAGVDEAVEHSLGMDVPQAGKAIRTSVRPAQLELIGHIDGIINAIETESVASAQHARGVYETALGMLWGLGALAVLFGVAVSVAMVQTIVPPLRRAVGAAERIATHDLTPPHLPESKDEVGQLMHALSSMTHALSESIAQISHAAGSFHASAAEIASGSQDLSARTEEAADKLFHTSASMAELTSSVGESSVAASKASQLVSQAADVARQGGVVVRDVVTTMQGIHQSSSKISDIIGVIDSIAFQTNILALNAAVEAARAGEQGRGFAVVASEVRNLAQRSAQAAQEIKVLIQDSVQKVAAGTQLVDKAGSTMDGIVHSVKEVDDVIADIARYAQAQQNEIRSIHDAITQLDQMTQQNASMVEQSTAASQSMQAQAERLREVVDVFRTERS